MADSRLEEKDQKVLIRWGAGLSVVWLIAMPVGFALLGNWVELKLADKLGSFLQGLFAPLAFGWLVIAVLLQTRELAQNREALLLQAEELRKSVEQLAAQTKLIREQNESMSLERTEASLRSRLSEVARVIANKLRKIVFYHDAASLQFGPSGGDILRQLREIDEKLNMAGIMGRTEEFFIGALPRMQMFERDMSGPGGGNAFLTDVETGELLQTIGELEQIEAEAIRHDLRETLGHLRSMDFQKIRETLRLIHGKSADQKRREASET